MTPTAPNSFRPSPDRDIALSRRSFPQKQKAGRTHRSLMHLLPLPEGRISPRGPTAGRRGLCSLERNSTKERTRNCPLLKSLVDREVGRPTSGSLLEQSLCSYCLRSAVTS